MCQTWSGTHNIERVLSSAARARLCPQMAGCGFSSVRTRIRWCFTCLACCVNHRDTPVPTEDTTSLQPLSSRLQVANLCEDGRAHTIHLFVLEHIGLDVFLLARTNALLSMRNLPERHKHFSVARWHVGGEFTMGGRCSRHGDTSSVSKACSLAVSMLWQAPRRTQKHWNRRRRVVGKTGSDIHAAITWMSAFEGSVVVRREVPVSMCSFCFSSHKQHEASMQLKDKCAFSRSVVARSEVSVSMSSFCCLSQAD